MTHLLLSLFFLFAATPDWRQLQCTGEPITGRYENFAEGFSVAVPPQVSGRRGQQSGPERGLSIPLASDCEGLVIVYAQANSLDWANARDAVTSHIVLLSRAHPKLRTARMPSRLGSLEAQRAIVSYDDVREDIVVAFRPGGGPVYTAHLLTTPARYERDLSVFLAIVQSFRTEDWR